MPRKQYTIHYIYKTTNIITGKFYVGMHSTFNIDDGYIGSGKRLWYSINKYGKENHTKEILEFCKGRVELKKKEKAIVNEDFIKDKMCMNLMVGGKGGFISREHTLKYRKAGRLAQKILRATNPEWVKKDFENRSRGQNASYINGRKGKFEYDWTGKKHKKETIEKMCKSQQGKHVGEKNSQYGKCWIYNIKLKNSKSIKKEELENYLNVGWIKGRKIKF